MSRLKLILLDTALAYLIWCFAPACGQAQAQTTPLTPAQAAESYWPTDDCTGRVKWIIVPAGYLNPDTADADMGTCTIRVSALELLKTTADQCWVAVHERGHLHGMPHSDLPLNVMYSGPNNTARSPAGEYCTSRFPEPQETLNAPSMASHETHRRNRKHHRSRKHTSHRRRLSKSVRHGRAVTSLQNHFDSTE